MTTRIAVAGGLGRMGQAIIELAAHSSEFDVVGVTISQGDQVPLQSHVSLDLFTQDIAKALDGADVLVDFTSPAALSSHASACIDGNIGWVLGTTGLERKHDAAVETAANNVPVCRSANFSTGINLMLQLVELVSAAVDDDTDLEVIEAHHRHKVDAPSGTALAIGEAMASSRGHSLDLNAVYSREGITGERIPGSIGFATVRAGDIIGEHTALFASEGERLEVTHRAGTRKAFARGALRAASWLVDRNSGLYDMRDVLRPADAHD
ncbi:MAG: 4-hydroxy-tetrahydrodipicolinate reductase [Pseudomonadota bacterium]